MIGATGGMGQANYSSSNSGSSRLTRSLAREACFHLARADKLHEDSIGITINAPAPGFIATEILEHEPETLRPRILQVPVSRFGPQDEIARVVHFLASDYSSFLTGAAWDVNGGQRM